MSEYDDGGVGAVGRKLLSSHDIMESSYVGAVLFVMFVCLVMGFLTPEIVVFLALLFVWIPGVITTDDALSGFSNNGMLTVGVLFVIVQSTHRSHIVPRLARSVFGVGTTVRWGLARLCLACYCLSALLNNTPIVCILIPVTRDWARTRGFAPSQFLIPLSYACILGGTATIIGTSTNLVVQGMIDPEYQFRFFDPTLNALPLGAAGILYLVCCAPLILPKHWGLFSFIRDRTEDLVTELHIEKGFKYIGMPIGVMLMTLGLDHTSIVKIRRKVRGFPQEVIGANQMEKDNIQEYWETKRKETLYHPDSYRDRTAHLWGRQPINIANTYSFDGIDLESMRGGHERSIRHSRGRGYSEPVDDIRNHFPPSSFDPVNSGHECENSETESVRATRDVQGARPSTTQNVPIRASSNDSSSLSPTMDYSNTFADVWPVPPDEILQEGDSLFLSVGLNSLLEFQKQASSVLKLEGLRFIACDALDIPGKGTDFFEVVISPENHFVGLDGHRIPNFEHHFKCSILALRKRGEVEPETIHGLRTNFCSKTMHSPNSSHHTIPKKKCDSDSKSDHINARHISGEDAHNSLHVHAKVEAMDRPWEVGDTVLLFAAKDFIETWKDTNEFLLISSVGSVAKRVTLWDYVPVFLFLAMLIIVVSTLMTMVKASFFIAGILLIFKFIPAHEALQAVDWKLLLLIGSSLGLSESVVQSGLAREIGEGIFSLNVDPVWILMILYIVVMIMTELITNTAAAALLVPIATSGAEALGVSPRPFYLAIMFAASSSFITPIGYQTNTMVWAPGGYKFSDFAKAGLPLSVISLTISCLLIPVLFPFYE